MNLNISNVSSKLVLFSCFCLLGNSTVSTIQLQAQVFELDKTGVPPQYMPTVEVAEQELNSRIQNYSNELPLAMLYQLDKLRILVRFDPAPEGILGFAAPTALVTFQGGNLFNQRRYAVPVAGELTININEVDFMIADGIFESVFVHEILHVFGVGSLWEDNDLIAPLGGVGAVQYIGGRYAIQQYRIETEQPFAVFVPLEQRGGPGTALGHWADQPPFFNQTFTRAFTKELMTGFACDVDPNTGAILCPPTFFSMTTEGSLADLGYAMYKLNPNSTPPPVGQAGLNWPKITGSGIDPFVGGRPQGGEDDGGGGGGGNLGFRMVNIQRVYRKHQGVGENVLPPPQAPGQPQDPFRLRNHSWTQN